MPFTCDWRLQELVLLLGSPCSVHEVAKEGTFVYWEAHDYLEVSALSSDQQAAANWRFLYGNSCPAPDHVNLDHALHRLPVVLWRASGCTTHHTLRQLV